MVRRSVSNKIMSFILIVFRKLTTLVRICLYIDQVRTLMHVRLYIYCIT